MKPEGCKCDGPFEKRDPSRWSWGHVGQWYYAVKECPLHSYQGGEPSDVRPRAQTRRKDPKPFSQFYKQTEG